MFSKILILNKTHTKLCIVIVHTNRVAPQDVQHACLSDGLKVGSTNHTVDPLMHKIRVAQLSCDVQN